MEQYLAFVAIVVNDYDEAKKYYCDTLGFQLIEDTPQDNGGKRWVVVAPYGNPQTRILLAKASSPEQSTRVGNQTGGRVAFFLHTDDFRRDFERFRAAGVKFEELPREEVYGTVAIFQDLYGNRWDLLQFKQ